MWWKIFLENPSSVSSLPRDRLEKSLLLTEKQLDGFDLKKQDVISRLHEICGNYLKLLSDNELRFFDRDRHETGGEIMKELSYISDEVLTKDDQINEDLVVAEKMLNRVNHREPAIVMQTKMVAQQTKTVSNLVDLITQCAINSTDDDEKVNCILAGEILNGDHRLLKMKLQNSRNYFNRKTSNMSFKLGTLIKKTVKLASKLQMLKDDYKNLDKLYPHRPMFGIEEMLTQDIATLGDTKELVKKKQREVEELKDKKETLANEIADMMSAASLEMSNMCDEVLLQQTIELKNNLMNAQLRENETTQQQRKMKSQLRSAKDDKDQTDERISQILGECETLRKAIESFQEKNKNKKQSQSSEEPKYSDEDIAYLKSIYQNPPNEKTLDQMQKELENKELYTQTLSKKIEDMKDQITTFDSRISELESLLSAGHHANESDE